MTFVCTLYYINKLFLGFEVTEDVIQIVQTLNMLDEKLDESFKSAFERELSQLKSPDSVMSELIKSLLDLPEEVG